MTKFYRQQTIRSGFESILQKQSGRPHSRAKIKYNKKSSEVIRGSHIVARSRTNTVARAADLLTFRRLIMASYHNNGVCATTSSPWLPHVVHGNQPNTLISRIDAAMFAAREHRGGEVPTNIVKCSIYYYY